MSKGWQLAFLAAAASCGSVDKTDQPDGSTASDGAADSATGGDASPAYAEIILADLPVGYWRLGEPDGATSTANEVGAVLTGTPAGGVTFGVAGALTADPNTAAHFDGLDDCIDLDMDPSIAFDASSSFTIELWFNQDTYVDAAREMVAKIGNTGSAGAAAGYAVGIQNGRPRLRVIDGVSGDNLLTADQVPLATFTHVVGTLEGVGNTASLYIDGMLAATATLTIEPLGTVGSLAIGCQRPANPIALFDGIIDEVAIYDRVLTEADVRRHYDAH